jgi:hypothetical protein
MVEGIQIEKINSKDATLQFVLYALLDAKTNKINLQITNHLKSIAILLYCSFDINKINKAVIKLLQVLRNRTNRIPELEYPPR